ncbi:MAG: hypothetical protein AAGM22_01480 [Acidobacteriota bacterium]
MKKFKKPAGYFVAALCVFYALYNSSLLISLIMKDGWTGSAVFQLALLAGVVIVVGTIGAGLGALVEAAMLKVAESKNGDSDVPAQSTTSRPAIVRLKKLAGYLFVAAGASYAIYNLVIIFSIIGEDGWDRQAFGLLGLLVCVLAMLGTAGAGFGALVQAAMLKVAESRRQEPAEV